MRDSFDIHFIGIGSGKSGSSWLYENIAAHPEIYDGNAKEINYYSDLYDTNSFSWYESLFKGNQNGQLMGEFSVTYIDNEKTPERIKKDFPDTRLICILRYPPNRIFSDYLHSMRKGLVSADLSFEEYCKDEHRLSFGLYSQKVQSFLKEFERDQLLILIYEEAIADPVGCISTVYEFLGLKDPSFIPEQLTEKVNQAQNYRFLKLENAITSVSQYLTSKGNINLLESLKRTGIHKVVRKLNSQGPNKSKMTAEMHARLHDYFGASIADLEGLLDRKIDTWQKESWQ